MGVCDEERRCAVVRTGKVAKILAQRSQQQCPDIFTRTI